MISDLKVSGVIKTITEIQSGTSKQGNEWKKLGFSVETTGDYPKKVYFTVFGGEKVDNFMEYNKVGQNVEVSFNVESREYNSRWYTDLNAWKVFRLMNQEPVGAAKTSEKEEKWHSVKDNDLPF
jgi:hypothetical protein